MTVETEQRTVAEPIYPIPCKRSVNAGLNAVNCQNSSQGMRRTFANLTRTINLHTHILFRIHGNGGAYTHGLRLFGTIFFGHFGSVGYGKGKRIGARLHRAERDFLTIGSDYRSIHLRSHAPHHMQVRTFKTARNKGFELAGLIHADAVRSIDRGSDKASVGNTYHHVTPYTATVAVGNRYRIACGIVLVFSQRLAQVGSFERGVGQTVPRVGIRSGVTDYRNAHNRRITHLDYRIGQHYQFGSRININTHRIDRFFHTDIFIVANLDGNQNGFIAAIDTVEYKVRSVRGCQHIVAVPQIVVTFVHGTGSRKFGRNIHTCGGITRHLRHRLNIMDNLDINVATVSRIAIFKTRIGGDGRATEQSVGHIVCHRSLVDKQGNVIEACPDAVIIAARIHNRPGSAMVG